MQPSAVSAPAAVNPPPPMSRIFMHTRTSPSAVASLKHVVESRLDLMPSNRPPAVGAESAGIVTKPPPAMPISGAPPYRRPPPSCTVATHAADMSSIETRLIMSVCGQFISKSPAHCNGYVGTPLTPPHALASIGDGMPPTWTKDLVANSCCAYVTTVGAPTPRRVYLPMAPPTREQIARCAENESYNRNVQINVASSLSSEHIPVLLASSANNREPGTVHINTSQPVQALGTTQCCEELLFGKNRTTSSPGFSVCNDIGITYAKAVHKYQQYSNVSVGANVTLVPTFHKRTPMVVSMSCPQLNLQQVVTSSSVPQNNTKFGPNHTVCAVEVLAKLTPFVKQCCETYMRLPRETVEDLREDGDMPVATCKSIEQCFAHDKANGVNAYVAKHTFSLDTAILNTHAVSSRQRAGNAGTGAGENAAGELTFPLEQKITVYLAALFGGAVADQHA
ncbi:hypothetical protein T484DRAFT_1757378 [Baffinella frigidus]|nr:hypothetical protein T484DRAFT_1757378 [Cryptophyta sp. CCMP2293]